MILEYPLTLSLEKTPFATQIRVTNVSGTPVFYVKQRSLSCIDEIIVYADYMPSQELYKISLEHGDTRPRQFQITDRRGIALASFKPEGRRKLWNPRRWICAGHEAIMVISESSPLLHLMDTIWDLIPIVSFFHGGIFRPTYHVTKSHDSTSVVMKIGKKPSFRERRFVIDKVVEIGHEEQIVVILGLIMILLLNQPHWSIVPS